VHKLERARHDAIIVLLKLPANERSCSFQAQYVDILLKDGSRRSFSMRTLRTTTIPAAARAPRARRRL